MKRGKMALILLLIVLLVSIPAVADAHWSFAGGWAFGLGVGFLTGYAVAPRTVYAAPPVYYYPPPPPVYPYYPNYVPAPIPPPPPGAVGTNQVTGVPPSPPSPAQPACREWKMTDRHWEKRWDPNYGIWRTVLVERWGWVGVPCRN